MNNDVLKETVKQLLEDINVSNDKIKSLLNAISGLEKVRKDHPLIEELKKEHDEVVEQQRAVFDVLYGLQNICPHPKWIDNGHDSHHDYYLCYICNKENQV